MRASNWVWVGLLCLAACGPKAKGNGNGDGDAGPPECTNGETQCVGNTFQRCVEEHWETQNQCTSVCNSDLGCVQCDPNRQYCVGNDVYACDPEGNQGQLIESCMDLNCTLGQCIDACAEAESNRSYIGCEYYAVDLDNAIEVRAPLNGPPGLILCGPPYVGRSDLEVCTGMGNTVAGLCDFGSTCPGGLSCQVDDACALDAQHSPFAIVVSNPQTYTVDLVLEDSTGKTANIALSSGEVKSIFPEALGFGDKSIDFSSLSSSAYKLTASGPIVAYQFNPLDNVDVFSNDGSLLIPRTTFDAKYVALTWPSLLRRPTTHDYNGYVAIVAWADGTEVTVTPTADIRAGTGVSAITAGTPTTFTLNAFEVLNLEAVADGDLTGTVIESATGATFGVFGGHEAVHLPNTSTSCCSDHIEEMMFPASTWGDTYAIARSADRGKGEADVVRILAQTDGTQVTVMPTGTCPTLNAGDYCEFDIAGDTEISATEPILVGHYLKSVNDGDGIGDPSLALAVPTEQFRDQYSFLVPSEYEEQWVSLVAPTGALVILDGVDVSDQLSPFGSGSFSGGRVSVTAGSHELDCPQDCGVEIYGYSQDVSYMFAGGLDLEQIVVL